MIQTGHEYDIRIEVTGRTAKLYLDNVLWGAVDDTTADPVYSVVTKDEKSGDTIVKVVNASTDKAPVDINVTGAANIAATAAVTTLTETADGQNLAPAASTFSGAGPKFTYTFEPNSVTFIRLAAQLTQIRGATEFSTGGARPAGPARPLRSVQENDTRAIWQFPPRTAATYRRSNDESRIQA